MRKIHYASGRLRLVFTSLTMAAVFLVNGRASESKSTDSHIARAGDVIGQLDLSDAKSPAQATRLVAGYNRMVAYHLKIDKGNLARWTASFENENVAVADYLKISDADNAAVQHALSTREFPKPPSSRYRVCYTALTDFHPGQPLPVRLSVVENRSIAPTGTLLATLKVNLSVLDKTQSNSDLAFSAVRTLADAARTQLRTLGVSDPYASTRIGVGVAQLEKLGRLLREDRAQVTLIASASTPVWQNDYTAVNVTWKIQPRSSQGGL
jgi:hypothetical protein